MNIHRTVLAVVALLLVCAAPAVGQVPPCVGCSPPDPPDPPFVQAPPPPSQVTIVTTDPLIGSVFGPALASHSHRMAFVTYPPFLIGLNRFFVLEVDGSGLREVHTTSQDIGGFTISGDGRMLAWVEGFFDSSLGGWTYNDIWVADLQTGSIINLTEDLFFFPKKQVFHSFAMTDAGDVIYATRVADPLGSFGQSKLDTWRLATDGSKAETFLDTFGLLTVSGDGKTIAFRDLTSPAIKILDADGEEQFSFTLPSPSTGGGPIGFDYAGKQLSVSDGAGGCFIVDLQTLEMTQLPPQCAGGNISGDGEWVTYSLQVPGFKLDSFRARIDGSEPIKIWSAQQGGCSISFDGSVLGCDAKTVLPGPPISEIFVTNFHRPNLTVAAPTSPGLPLLVTVNGRAGQAFALLLSVPDGGQASEPSRAVRVAQGRLDATGSSLLQGSLPADPALLGFTADLVALVGPAPLSPNADLTNTVRVVVE